MKAKTRNTYGVVLSHFEAYKTAQKNYEGLSELYEHLSDIEIALNNYLPVQVEIGEDEKRQTYEATELINKIQQAISEACYRQQITAMESAKEGKLIK